MITFLRLIKGYVIFCAEGGFAERFLNLCRLRGISLWDIKNDGVKVEACTTIDEFNRLSEPAKNSGMEIEVLKNRGLPFFIKRHKWRCGAVLGLFFTIILVWFASGFIWEVEIVEENGVKPTDFTQTLTELGVKTGVRKSKIDILQVQEELLNIYPELSWVSLNIFGGKAQIEYTPAREQLEIEDTKNPVNIVAAKSGKVTLVEGYRGTNKVKEGEFVAEGSLIISAITINADGSENLVHASGKVFAQTKNTTNYSEPLIRDGYITAFPERRYSVNFFNAIIPFGMAPDGDMDTASSMMLEGNSAVLPVGILREDTFSVDEREIGLTEEQGILKALTKAVSEKRAKYKDAELQKVEYKTSSDKKAVNVSEVVVCVEDIATEKAVYVE